MGENRAEYEQDDALDTHEFGQALVYGILVLASVVWLVVGIRDGNPVVLSV